MNEKNDSNEYNEFYDPILQISNTKSNHETEIHCNLMCRISSEYHNYLVANRTVEKFRVIPFVYTLPLLKD